MEIQRFSCNGEYLSVCGSDGRLRIWETKDRTSTLKQEFVPSAHLSATCTCIEWAPSSTQQVTGKKKKKKRSIEGDIVVMGTAVGSLLFYSVAKSQLFAHTPKAHTGAVTGLSWSSSTLSLYSCGEDGYIVEWDPEKAATVGRWKASKGPLSCLTVFNDFLLCAGQGITLWNIETKTSTMSFLGHPTAISQIEPVANTDYFVTMCLTERYLRIWSRTEKNSVAILSLTENPSSFSVMSSSDSIVTISVVSQNGTLFLFQHKLNGPMRKPLSPQCVFKINDTNSNSKESLKVPILTAFLLNQSNVGGLSSKDELKFAYGSWLRLKFEDMHLKYLQDEVTIKREFGVGAKIKGKGKKEVEKEIVEVPKDAKHLQPGTDLGGGGLGGKEGKGKKRKKNEEGTKEDDGELPMEERLSNLTIDQKSSGVIPDGNNLAHLLSQGLHSKDARTLESVLTRWDQDLITNTVRSLPVQLIVQLLNEIKLMLSHKALLNHSVVKWLKTIFQIHSAFLMSCPSSEELLRPFMSLLHSRETVYPQMCQLKGKLELIKGNIQAKEHKAEVPNEALLVYQDESPDEGEDDDFIPSESEEFIGSDELEGDDDDDESSDGSEMDDSDVEAVTESESDEDDDTAPVQGKRAKSSKSGDKAEASGSNKFAKLNGTIQVDSDDEDDDEMDE